MPPYIRSPLFRALGLAFAAVLLVVIWQRPAQVEFQPFTQQRLAERLAVGKCVVVELYADWDLTSSSQIRRMSDRTAYRMRRNGIAALSADCTESSAETAELRKRFEIESIPAILIFSPREPDRPKIFRDLIWENHLLEALDECEASKRG